MPPPADSPKISTLVGYPEELSATLEISSTILTSPPNASMLSCTHCRAKSVSFSAAFEALNHPNAVKR